MVPMSNPNLIANPVAYRTKAAAVLNAIAVAGTFSDVCSDV